MSNPNPTPYQSAYPSLPPGYDHALVRTVRVPRNPERLTTSYDEFSLDLRPLFVLTEQSVDFVLSHVGAWWATINTFAWKVDAHAKVWRNEAVRKAIEKFACTRTEAKNEFIYQDHDWVQWEEASVWLERMSKALGDIMLKTSQTFSANMRQQYAQPTPTTR